MKNLQFLEVYCFNNSTWKTLLCFVFKSLVDSGHYGSVFIKHNSNNEINASFF